MLGDQDSVSVRSGGDRVLPSWSVPCCLLPPRSLSPGWTTRSCTSPGTTRRPTARGLGSACPRRPSGSTAAAGACTTGTARPAQTGAGSFQIWHWFWFWLESLYTRLPSWAFLVPTKLLRRVVSGCGAGGSCGPWRPRARLVWHRPPRPLGRGRQRFLPQASQEAAPFSAAGAESRETHCGKGS